MPSLSPAGQTDCFIVEFDAAIEAHMDWARVRHRLTRIPQHFC